ncbi:acyl-CoA thioesterase [Elizabethkingia miricola]|nr:thioesterase family protein [Elizabethkingia miricola]NHQ68415.1 thioesterase [Elizabethkingia miricola]PSL86749.1 thioesterase [Elizabethkingia miricola]QHQ85837.1 thioesterase [Elizabethkingia miricola]UIO97075.1 thioesterase family protein [Elizabethkingia miricola]WER13859.1 thioesterase family protein [Elizabethkingia miricola]
MQYSKEYKVKTEHIDVQGIMDGLYYPFYMEYCRHEYIDVILGLNLENEAKKGVNMVLSGYTINFLRSLKQDDTFIVTCELFRDKNNTPKLYFKQSIMMNNKIITKAIFTGTCVLSTGGRPFIPETIKSIIENAPVLEV